MPSIISRVVVVGLDVVQLRRHDSFEGPPDQLGFREIVIGQPILYARRGHVEWWSPQSGLLAADGRPAVESVAQRKRLGLPIPLPFAG
ncbi:MAG: hypothetical protein JRI25_01070 [Deltaproteobacteria bacterium]|nr:hypothetical protein [Deltaproteobacteria bacterium]